MFIMQPFFYISILVFVGYIILILCFFLGWIILPPARPVPLRSFPMVSVVIALRNERHNVPFLIKALAAQTYANYEVIIVDDYSDDGTRQVLEDFSADGIIVIPNTLQPGKKYALTCGIGKARGEIIISTDADCRPDKNWISSFVRAFQEYDTDLVLGNVTIKYERLLSFGALQALEFSALLASTAGAAALRLPFMANGANIAFRRQLWNMAQLNFSHPSGDDVFLLFAAKKHGRKIFFLKDKNSSVPTQAQKSIADFLHQRLRWASKASKYTDFMAIAVAAEVFLVNFILLVFLFFYPQLFLFFFALKSIPDLLLLMAYLRYYGKMELLLWFFVEEFLYIFYAVFIGIFSQFLGFRWKGRTYRK